MTCDSKINLYPDKTKLKKIRNTCTSNKMECAIILGSCIIKINKEIKLNLIKNIHTYIQSNLCIKDTQGNLKMCPL